jgi:hypothetical protein
MIDYHLAKRDYLEESKKKLRKQIELSEKNLCLFYSVLYCCFLCCFCIYVVVICINTKIS